MFYIKYMSGFTNNHSSAPDLIRCPIIEFSANPQVSRFGMLCGRLLKA